MDIDNVSDHSQYFEILVKQQKALKDAMARQGQRPKDFKCPQELIQQLMMRVLMQKMMGFDPQNNTRHFISTSFLPIPYGPSVTPLDELQPIHIKNLRLETHHRGSYLLVRALTPPDRITAIMAVVEDENAVAIQLQLYQQPDENLRPATSVIMKNDVFLIKEPYLKTTSDGGYGLRVDHVSDAIRLGAFHDMVPEKWKPTVMNISKTADDWKQEGNEEMGGKHYWAAIQSYTAALECPSSADTTKTIRLNRALANLRDGCLDAALADTECMISLTDASEKALYRAGLALYGLGRFSECHDIFDHLCKKYPLYPPAATELKRVCCRLTEQQSGMYNFKSMYKTISTIRPPQLDHATFIGSVVVKSSPGRGLGLFTTKAVKAGELLLCEKAFTHCYAGTPGDSDAGSKTTLLVNLHTNKMTMGTQGDLITNIVQRLWKNPSLIPEFTALYHGSYKLTERTKVDESPVIDTFLVEQIIALNVFGCPLSSYEAHSKGSKDDYKHHSCGIWLMASRINHSCLSNAHRSFIGDLQLIRACRDLPADTEITFFYRMPTGDSDEMKKGLETWGFQCKCVICLDSKELTKNQTRLRKKLLGDLEVTLSANNIDTVEAERLLNALDKTYKQPATSIPRIALQGPYFKLAVLYSNREMANKSVSMTLKALESLGFVIKNASLPAISSKSIEIERLGLMMPGVVEAWIHLCQAYFALAPQNFQKAEDCAKLVYKICIGEDDTFKIPRLR